MKYQDDSTIRLTSIEIARLFEREAERFVEKYRNIPEVCYLPLYREILKSVRYKVRDGSHYSKNNFFLLAWEIMVKVCQGLPEGLKDDFPHLVIGVDGQGLLQKLHQRTHKIYAQYLRPFE